MIFSVSEFTFRWNRCLTFLLCKQIRIVNVLYLLTLLVFLVNCRRSLFRSFIKFCAKRKKKGNVGNTEQIEFVLCKLPSIYVCDCIINEKTIWNESIFSFAVFFCQKWEYKCISDMLQLVGRKRIGNNEEVVCEMWELIKQYIAPVSFRIVACFVSLLSSIFSFLCVPSFQRLAQLWTLIFWREKKKCKKSEEKRKTIVWTCGRCCTMIAANNSYCPLSSKRQWKTNFVNF